MGEWIVFRERKDNAKPFFWNMYTEEKSWDAPAILQELGVADVLQNLRFGSQMSLENQQFTSEHTHIELFQAD